MKKMIIALFAFLTMTVSANAMSYEQARNEALFLTDKMAYELNLTDLQYEAAYEINLDYLMSVTDHTDVFGLYWERRNQDIRYILYSWQWDAFCAATYFFRPLIWDGGYWHFGIYARYPRRDYFYFGRPHFYASYRGGHSWRMNGGRSYYEGRRDHFRPGHVERGSHFGMRSGWDRGDYRNQHHGSSTRVTGPGRHDNNGGYRNDGRGGNSSSGHFEGRRSGSENRSGGSFEGRRSGSENRSGGSFEGRRSGSENRSGGSFEGRSSGSENRSGGSFEGRRSGSVNRSGGSFEGRRSGSENRSFGGSRSNGSHSSGSYGGRSSVGGSSVGSSSSSNRGSGSFSGSRSSGSHSSGSFSGGHSGGSRSGGSHGGSATRGGGDNSRGSSRR